MFFFVCGGGGDGGGGEDYGFLWCMTANSLGRKSDSWKCLNLSGGCTRTAMEINWCLEPAYVDVSSSLCVNV